MKLDGTLCKEGIDGYNVILNRDELRNKIYGCWLGKNIGGSLGGPYEGRREILDVKGYSTPALGAIMGIILGKDNIPAEERIMRCLVCEQDLSLISSYLGVCISCVRERFDEALPYIVEAHSSERASFELPSVPPETKGGSQNCLFHRIYKS